MTINLTLNLDKETKGAVRYGDGKGHNIYLRKDEISVPYPKTIQIVITMEGEITE